MSIDTTTRKPNALDRIADAIVSAFDEFAVEPNKVQNPGLVIDADRLFHRGDADPQAVGELRRLDNAWRAKLAEIEALGLERGKKWEQYISDFRAVGATAGGHLPYSREEFSHRLDNLQSLLKTDLRALEAEASPHVRKIVKSLAVRAAERMRKIADRERSEYEALALPYAFPGTSNPLVRGLFHLHNRARAAADESENLGGSPAGQLADFGIDLSDL